MLRQMCRVQPRLPTVDGVRQGEQPRKVGIALPRPGQENEARTIQQGELAAGDGPDLQAVGEASEVQRPAEVGVGQGKGRVTERLGLGEQLVRVGGSRPEGVEALGVQLNVSARLRLRPKTATSSKTATLSKTCGCPYETC